MNKTAYLLVTIAMIISTTFTSYSVAVKPDSNKNEFYGIKSGDIETLKYIEKKYPAIIKPWLNTREANKEIHRLYKVFGTIERKNAEKKVKKLIIIGRTENKKFQQQYAICKDNIAKKLHTVKKKIKSLEKKKQLTQSVKEKLENLREEASYLKKAPAALQRMEEAMGSPRLNIISRQLTRLRINAGELAKRQFESNAPKVINYRMVIQDNIADIKRIKNKDKKEFTTTEKQKIKKAELNIKSNYIKLTKAAELYKKQINTQRNKYKKAENDLTSKIEKLEKMKRSTDKLDRKRLNTLQEIDTLDYQIDVVNKVLACKEAKKLVPSLGQ